MVNLQLTGGKLTIAEEMTEEGHLVKLLPKMPEVREIMRSINLSERMKKVSMIKKWMLIMFQTLTFSEKPMRKNMEEVLPRQKREAKNGND